MKQMFGLRVEHHVLSRGLTTAQKTSALLIAWSASWNAAYGTPEQQPQAITELSCPPAVATDTSQVVNAPALQLELTRLAQLAEVCDMRADYHAHVGTLLLTADLPKEAAVSLEKALLLNPDLAGVQIDYAQTLSKLGQRQTAQALLGQVTQRPDIDPKLKQWLLDNIKSNSSDAAKTDRKPNQWGQNGSHLLEGRWLWDGSIQALIGRESNLAGLTYTTVLPLYLDSGIVEVSLADSERPQAGTALKTVALVNALRPLAAGQIRWNLALQKRHTPNQDALKSHSLETRLSYAHASNIGIVTGTLGWSAFEQTQQQYRDYSYRLEYQPPGQMLGCAAAMYTGRVIQRYADDNQGSGSDRSIGLRFGCGQQTKDEVKRYAQTVIDFNTGRYSPQVEDYPGGIKRRNQLQIQHLMPLSSLGVNTPATLTMFARWRQTHDQRIVSSLFGPEPTRTRRAEIGLGYWHPWSPAWSWGIEIDHSWQRSSNKLLDIKNRSIYTGVRRVFQ